MPRTRSGDPDITVTLITHTFSIPATLSSPPIETRPRAKVEPFQSTEKRVYGDMAHVEAPQHFCTHSMTHIYGKRPSSTWCFAEGCCNTARETCWRESTTSMVATRKNRTRRTLSPPETFSRPDSVRAARRAYVLVLHAAVKCPLCVS